MKRSDLSSDGLRVAIGLPSAVMLVVGGIVGVGIFVNPAVVARSVHTPGLVVAAWVLGGVIALLGALVYAELAARMPATGGEYVYLRDTYGRLAGFLFGWTTLLVVHTGGLAAVAIVFAKNVNVLFGGGLPEPALVVAALGGLAAINCMGVVPGNGVQGALGALKIVAAGALIAAGLCFAPKGVQVVANDAPVDTVKSFGAAMIAVTFSYGGWQTANYVAGEMKESARNLGRALLVGVVVVIALYVLVNIACLHALGVVALGATLTPTSAVLQLVAGAGGAKLAAAAISLSAFGYLSQGMLTGPRVFFAMARDGYLFRGIASVNAASRVPVGAILLVAGWAGVLALSGSYEQILSYVIAMNFLFFGLSASCVFTLRRRERDSGMLAPAGYRAFGHPWTTGLFIVACGLIVVCSFWSFPVNSLIGYVILLMGVPPYLYWRGRRRA